MNKVSAHVKNIVWYFVAICSSYGIYAANTGIQNATSAVQEIDALAFGMALSIIPYVLARALSEVL